MVRRWASSAFYLLGQAVGQDLGLLGLEDRGHYNPLKCQELLT